jgi:hypothetical protein
MPLSILRTFPAFPQTARRPRRVAPLVCLVAGLASLVSAAAAQSSHPFLVSTTTDAGAISPALPFLEDQHALLVGPGAQPRPFLTDGHWRALSSLIPGDIDGLSVDRAQSHAFPALRFSLLSDEGGFLDGDILSLRPGGSFDVVVSESALTSALGLPTASIDVDAFEFDAAGGLYFSLQNDLPGSVLGDLADGDVLYLSTAGQLSRPFTEAAVQQALNQATGSTALVGDVQGIAWLGNGIAVAVQSPSAFDGAILRLTPVGLLLATESELGLGGAEFDGLTSWPTSFPRLSVWFEAQGSPGLGRGVIEGAPFEVVTLIPASSPGHESATYLPGFGAWCLAPNDPLIGVALSQGLPLFGLDSSGRREFQVNLSPALAGLGYDSTMGYSYQALSLTSGELSAPLRVEF